MKRLALGFLLIATACGRERPASTKTDVTTPVEHPDIRRDSDWCARHGTPESTCAACGAREVGSNSEAGGSCGATTPACEEAPR